MKLVMFLAAAISILLADRFWRASSKEADEDVALFIGSARPIAAKALAKRSTPAARRSQKRTQIV